MAGTSLRAGREPGLRERPRRSGYRHVHADSSPRYRAAARSHGNAESSPGYQAATRSHVHADSSPGYRAASHGHADDCRVHFGQGCLGHPLQCTGGPEWYSNENWLSDEPAGQWDGVTTDGDGRVLELSLRGNGLSGEIPPELGNLANLLGLYFGGNQLNGEIPPKLGNLAKLVGLGLSGNELSGEIPPSWAT